MEKVKFQMDMVPEAQMKVFDCGIVCSNRIPYDKKEDLAKEIVMSCYSVDQQTGMFFKVVTSELFEAILVMKYYTNFDTGSITDNEKLSAIHDYLFGTEIFYHIRDYILLDFEHVQSMVETMVTMLREKLELQNSLSYHIMQSFGFLFTNEDMAQAIAKSEDVSNAMVELMKNAKVGQEKSNANKIKMPGGLVVNFSKKKKG